MKKTLAINRCIVQILINLSVKKFALLLFILFFTISLPYNAKAASVDIEYTKNFTQKNYIEFPYDYNLANDDKILEVSDWTVSLSKGFDLVAQNRNLNQGNESIPSGINITAKNNPLTGSYNYVGKDQATPPLDGSIHTDIIDGICYFISFYSSCFDVLRARYRGDISNQVDYTLTSSNSNVVNCDNGKTCVTTGPGSAQVTVSFPDTGYYYLERLPLEQAKYECTKTKTTYVEGNGKVGSGGTRVECIESKFIGWEPLDKDGYKGGFKKAFTYRLRPITYNITVPQQAPVNNLPVTSCQGVDSVTTTSVRVKWSYSDADGDAQGGGRIEVANLDDTSFSAPVKILNFSGADIRDFVISDLTPGTTYNYRIRSNDGKVAGNWATCGTFQTISDQPPANNIPVTSCQGVDNINYTSVRVKWTYSDPDGDPQSFGRVQVANLSDPGFTAPIVNQQVFGADVRDYTVNNLTQGTSYNYRVRVNDGKSPSDWANCGTFQTKVNQPPTLTYTNTTNISYNTATANWTYSDPDGDPQLRYELKVLSSAEGREDFSGIFNGSATSSGISGLRPGTTYTPRIRVENGPNGWTGWVVGPQFTTLVNNPPNLDQLSCGAVSGSTDYERAKLSWNYTGTDEPGDQLIFKLRWKRTDEMNWSSINLPSNRTGESIINNLISGYTYNVEVSLNDNVNSYLGDRWKGCGTVTPPNYPVPNVDFSLNSGALTAQKGGTLTVKTGDPVGANWSVTNTEGVSSCTVNTTGGDGVNLLFGIGFSGSSNKTAPTNQQDLTYQVRLTCTGKPALQVRNVSEIITLRVESYPTVSCSIEGGKKSVSQGDSKINLNITVGNTPTYSWEVGKFVGDTNTQKGVNPIPGRITLDYINTDFGKYSPWVKVVNSNTLRTTEKSCGTITNFGDGKIREVNP